MPAGGQLCISGNADYALTARKVVSYPSRMSTTPIEETGELILGSGGTNLGSWQSTIMNHPHRIALGSNNYKESAIRQFLNSDGLAGEYWTPQTIFDRPPAWVSSQPGFLSLISEELASVIKPVDIGCKTNDIYEAPDSTCGGIKKKYTLRDKVFLASGGNIGIPVVGTVFEDVSLWDFYVGATADDRIKLSTNGVANSWRVRTPTYYNASYVMRIDNLGYFSDYGGHTDMGVVPAFVIY